MIDITIYSALIISAISLLPWVVIKVLFPRKKLPNFKKYLIISILLVFSFAVIGFLVGYIGPLIFMPESNQGPLIGIFVTGPLGGFIGLLITWVLLLSGKYT